MSDSIGGNGPQVAEGGYAQTLKRSTDMENTNDIPNEEQTSRLQQLAVSRIFSTAEEAREYMRSEGLDPEVEEAFGREVISELKAKVAAKKRNEEDPYWHPSCTRRLSDGMCNCG